MTPDQAINYRDAFSLLLGEITRLKIEIQQGRVTCQHEYAEMVENAFLALRDLTLETHTLFCGEAS